VLKATELALRLGAALEWDAQSQKAVGSLLIEAEWKGGQVAFSFEQADSFLKQVIPLDALSLDFDALLRWTESSGLTFQGGAGLHYSRALHKSIGPLTLRQLDIVIAPSEKGVSLEASSSINLNIGPFSATVERMGLELGANGSDSQYIAFGAGFKPPRGLALSINASAVTGGGYLFFDPENKRYAGAVQLSFTQLSLAAIGLLTTQLPDGSDGFSFLIIITAEFPPIQLGFGFTLNGVGGLVGIHRKVVTKAIRKGLHNQTLDSILFPENPVENAPRIISDLRTVFPPVHGQFTFGPMAILGWGVPQTLVSLKLGIIIEMPSPLRLVILGQLRTRIPSEEAALIRLNMDVLGIIDFHAQRASVDAVLYDSRLTQFTLSGEMAMRMRWGNKPAFLMAVGGFNARFNPPDEFPELDRISISRDLGIAKLTLKTYLAVTSNTLQFGAALRVYASAAKFSLEAELAFHVLIQFEPFRFVADIDGSASIKRGGNSIASVGFHGKLAGPSPWRARGKASVSIGFIKAKVSFNKTFGQAEQPSTPSTNIWPDLQKALEAQQSWNAQLPADDTMLVSLRKVSSSDENDEVLVHPLGALSVEQKIVPLDTAVEKYGGYNVEGQRLFRLTGVALARRSLTFTTSQRTEQFAPAKYFNISEKEKLEGPSFETFAAGQDIEMKTDPSDIATARDPQPKETEYGYDTTLIDEPLPEDMQQQASTPTYKVEKSMLMASAHMGAKAQASRSGPARFAAPGKGVQTGPVTYTLADADTLDAMQLDTVSPQDVARTLRAGHHTYTAARQALKQYEQAHPRRRGQYIIAAEHEVTGGSNG
jgi:hypothetical protein